MAPRLGLFLVLGVSAAAAACGSGSSTLPHDTGGAGATGTGGGASSSSGTGAGSSSSGASSSSGVASSSSSSSTTSASGGGPCGAGYVCAPAPPAGTMWNGPAVLYQVSALPAACPAQTTQVVMGYTNLEAPPAVCGPCTCGAPIGLHCADTRVAIYDNTTCSGSFVCVDSLLDSSCGQVMTAAQCSGGTSMLSAKLETGAAGISCPPSPQVPTLPPVTWDGYVELCAPTGGPQACGTGEVCAPSPGGSAALCIYQLGGGDFGWICPPGPYTKKSIVSSWPYADLRGCTGCLCTAPVGQCSGGQAMISSDPSCGTGTMSPVSETCATVGIPPDQPYFAELITPPTMISGTCQVNPGGAQPTGGLSAYPEFTVCCLP